MTVENNFLEFYGTGCCNRLVGFPQTTVIDIGCRQTFNGQLEVETYKFTVDHGMSPLND